MKKILVTIPKSSGEKTFTLFSTVEAAYVYTTSPEKIVDEQMIGAEKIVLRDDEFLEAEWHGCEFIYDKPNETSRIDFIRCVKAQKPKNSAGLLVDVFSGWIIGDVLPFKNVKTKEIVVNLISSEESKIDMSRFFADEQSINNRHSS